MATFTDQLFLVDSEDNVVKQIDKYTAHNWKWIANDENALPHRAFSLLIFNKKFELLLQQRSEIKVTFPLYWSNSCCSHPRVGLSTIEIAKEATDRARYELGSNLSLHKPRFLTRVLYKSKSDENWGEYEMDYVFFAQANDSSDVNINIEEVKDTTWVNRDEIRRFVNRKDLLITPWFNIFLNQTRLLDWWEAFEDNSLEKYENSREILDLR